MTYGPFYRVITDIHRRRLPDPQENGYETARDFRHALFQIVGKWGGRLGEKIGERHGFMLLRFHDTPGGKPDEEWLPPYMLEPAEQPEWLSEERDEVMEEIDEAFGFE